jgi:hypothetical protein
MQSNSEEQTMFGFKKQAPLAVKIEQEYPLAVRMINDVPLAIKVTQEQPTVEDNDSTMTRLWKSIVNTISGGK